MKMLLNCLAGAALVSAASIGAAFPAGWVAQAALGQPAPELWSNPATWGGRVPVAGQSVTIPKGKTVLLDVNTPALRGLRIEGALLASTARDLLITSDNVVVMGGRLSIGTAAAPHPRRVTITLTGSSAADLPGLAGMGNKLLGVMGGCIELHGQPSLRNWTKLGADAAKGARTITLAEAPGWRVGDEVVIATSSRSMNEFDRGVISAISGRTITLAQPLKFRHLGAQRTVGTRPIDVRAEVGLLSKNIVVQGDETSLTSRIGGHAMFMNGMCPGTGTGGCSCGNPLRTATVQIANAEFRRMGQFNRLGRYPIHLHQMGAMTNSYLRDNVVKDSIQRGIVLHDVSGVQATGNVVFNTVGHNFVVETEITTGNEIIGNLALVNRQPAPMFTDPQLQKQNDREPANFWMKSGSNVVRGNSAAGSMRSGFIYDGIDARPINFSFNTAHAAMGLDDLPGQGDFDLAAGVLIVSEDVRPSTDKISDFLAYHNSIGVWPEETGLFKIERMVAADNDIATENRGVGNRVLYKDSLFVGTLTEPRTDPVQGNHFQYGSDVVLENPTFANFESGGITSVTDSAILPHSNIWITNAKFIGPRPAVPIGEDTVATYTDDSILPKGTYVAYPEYAAPGAAVVPMPYDDGFLNVYRSAVRPSYSELDVRRMAAPGQPTHGASQIRRSDGLRFLGAMRGYAVITNLGLFYQVLIASPSGFALRLSEDATSGPGPTVDVIVPLAAAPSGVYRGEGDFDNPGPARSGERLRLATSRADFNANPLTTYLYNAASKQATVKAANSWVQVLP